MKDKRRLSASLNGKYVYNNYICIYEDEFTEQLLFSKVNPKQKRDKWFEVYDMKTNIKIGEWNNQTHCAKDLGISIPSVGKCLNNKQKNACGYIFKYKESELKEVV